MLRAQIPNLGVLMGFLKAEEEERGCCLTLRIAQIGGFFATVVQCSAAKQHELSLSHTTLTFSFFVCMHYVAHFGQSRWTAALNLVYPISWYDRTKLRSKINLISKTFCFLTLLPHANRDSVTTVDSLRLCSLSYK